MNFIVNHSVDADVEPELNPSAEKPELGEMKSRPQFEVEIKRNGQILGFTCTIVAPNAEVQENEYSKLRSTINEGFWIWVGYLAGILSIFSGNLYQWESYKNLIQLQAK